MNLAGAKYKTICILRIEDGLVLVHNFKVTKQSVAFTSHRPYRRGLVLTSLMLLVPFEPQSPRSYAQTVHLKLDFC